MVNSWNLKHLNLNYGISEGFKGSKGSEVFDGSVGSEGSEGSEGFNSWGSRASGFSSAISWFAMASWGLSEFSANSGSGLETSIGSFSLFSPSAEKRTN